MDGFTLLLNTPVDNTSNDTSQTAFSSWWNALSWSEHLLVVSFIGGIVIISIIWVVTKQKKQIPI